MLKTIESFQKESKELNYLLLGVILLCDCLFHSSVLSMWNRKCNIHSWNVIDKIYKFLIQKFRHFLAFLELFFNQKLFKKAKKADFVPNICCMSDCLW